MNKITDVTESQRPPIVFRGPTVEELESGLFHVLQRMTTIRGTQHRRAQREGTKAELVTIASDLLRDPRTLDGCRAADLAEGHPEAAERLAVCWIGEQLWECTRSTDAMRDVLYRVAERSLRWGGVWLGICDKCWDGIGDRTDIWVA
jgi:hypothetical protein